MKYSVMALIAAAFMSSVMATPALAVDYVKQCTLYGDGWFYVPGTDRCIQAETEEIRHQGPDGTVIDRPPEDDASVGAQALPMDPNATKALAGVAMSVSLPTAQINSGDRFSVAGTWGTFAGYDAAGFAGALKLTDHVNLIGGVGGTLEGRARGGRAGFNLSW